MAKPKRNSKSERRFAGPPLVLPALAGLGLLLTVVLAVRDQNTEVQGPGQAGGGVPASSTQTPAPGVSGTFPPAFSDARPDLSESKDHVDVCGIGRVRVRPDGQPDLADGLTGGEQLIEAAAAKLATSGSDYDRAVALYVRGVAAAGQRISRDGAVPRGTDDSREQLARLATGSRDPGVYALAFYLCGSAAGPRSTGTGSCGQISAAQWTLIDANNAVPWLYEAGFALQRQDPKAVDAALLRASQANVLRLYKEAPLRLIDAPAVRSASPTAAANAAVKLVGISAAVPAPNLQMISQYCASSAKSAAERNQVCSELAEVLTGRSTATIGMRLGAVVGERVGWSSEKLASVRKRTSELQQAQARVFDKKDLYSCAAIERSLSYLSAFAKYGEVGALERQLSAAAGESKQSQAVK